MFQVGPSVAYLIAGKLKFNVAELWPSQPKENPTTREPVPFRPSPVLC